MIDRCAPLVVTKLMFLDHFLTSLQRTVSDPEGFVQEDG